jgi:UDP-glucuronate 4-epimerase
MATYLVTGVAGFIASKVAEQLLEAGHTVVGVDNLNDYYDVRLKLYRLGRLARQAGVPEAQVMGHGLSVDGWQIQAPITNNLKPITLKSDRFEFHTLDIEDLPALERVFERSDFSAVFNLAARAGVRYSLEFPELYRRTNVLGEENVLKCQVKYGVSKHVLASSSSVYAGCPMPFVEDARLGKMQSPYAETKRQAELLALDYYQENGIDVSALRYFTVFGPAGRPDMAPFRFIKWISEGTPITLYGDGTQARDFTYVDDIARGTILAGRLFGGQMSDVGCQPSGISGLRSQVSGFSAVAPSYDVINLGGGNNPLSITAMIGIIEAALGKRAKINTQPASAADMKETWADISKAKRLLGWEPLTETEAGFRKAVEWHLLNSKLINSVTL